MSGLWIITNKVLLMYEILQYIHLSDNYSKRIDGLMVRKHLPNNDVFLAVI